MTLIIHPSPQWLPEGEQSTTFWTSEEFANAGAITLLLYGIDAIAIAINVNPTSFYKIILSFCIYSIKCFSPFIFAET